VAFADIPIGLPAGSYQGVEYSAIIYGRGPLFVDALAARVGAEVFSRFLQQYLQRNKWQIVSTAIFMSEAEAACSCELDALFEEWVLP
jgi:aminopeptidase N